MRLYVYGVTTAAEGAVPAGLSGVGGASAPVRLLPAGPIAAVVSPAPALVRARRRDVMAHQEVLTRLSRTAPLLPATFGLIAEDEPSLRASLERDAEAKLAALERVRGRAEMNLKVAAVERGLAELVRGSEKLRRLRAEVERNPDYTARIRLGEAVADGLRQRAELVAEEARRLLFDLVEDAVPGPEADGYVANISFLVDLGQLDAVSEAVERLAAEAASHAELRLTGPLPCYSFCAQPTPQPVGV
ncbi:GvpL/GvpF family gas vesicle protein [Actinospica robiniae]|uniref:GvpL/GvpF family gas vesicle protein n=1 Tax=Actinospica robiniae TaxID=304901 RepID=UPI000406D318|nr:GvpL/GvpF family gas vesicle protein [Actinospica robiniae]